MDSSKIPLFLSFRAESRNLFLCKLGIDFG